MFFYVAVPAWLFIAGIVGCFLYGVIYFEHANEREPKYRISNIIGGFSVSLIGLILLLLVFSVFFHGTIENLQSIHNEIILFSFKI